MLVYRNKYSLLFYIDSILFFILYGIVKYLPAFVGDVFRAGVLFFFAKKMRTIWIKDGATFWYPRNIELNRNVSINEFVFIDGYGGVEIGEATSIAHRCSIISEDHVFSDPDRAIIDQGKTSGRVVIGRDCWLGADVKVLKGVTIGDGCVIGAGSVVTSDIPPYSIATGIPACVVKKREPA